MAISVSSVPHSAKRQQSFRRHILYSKPHYGFPESHSKQTIQPNDAQRSACIPIRTLIPLHAPQASRALSDASGIAAWRLLTSLNQLARIIRSFEETPGNADIPLDIVPILTSVAVSMSKKGLGFGSSYSNGMDRCLDVTGPAEAPDRKQSA